MAQGLGFIEFSTGDVLSAAAANGYLASQTVMVFANAAARTAAITTPYEGMFSYLKDTNATEYYTGSAWATLGGGAAGGKVLQVVYASSSTSTTVASTTYTDSGLSASITPTASTSKVLVIVDQALYVERAIYVAGGSIQLLRGASVIQATGAVFGFNSGSSPGSNLSALQSMNGINYLDSPATTSSTTYKTQIKADTTANGGYIAAQFGSTFSSITLLEIGA